MGGGSLLCLLGGRLIQIRPCATAMLDAQEHGAAWAGAREALPSTTRRGAARLSEPRSWVWDVSFLPVAFGDGARRVWIVYV